jgi:hypothetical protein
MGGFMALHPYGIMACRPISRQQILNKQQLSYNNGGTVGHGVLYLAHAKGVI